MDKEEDKGSVIDVLQRFLFRQVETTLMVDSHRDGQEKSFSYLSFGINCLIIVDKCNLQMVDDK
jgi:hypothetical protein